jgi:thioredoxin-dependent peroxiredoxin
MIDRGDVAPDFELCDQDGVPVRLSSLRGQTVVLYFYPAAMTPGCTIQACGMRDRHDELERADAVVLGISPDKPKRLRHFAGAFDLPFKLLSDPDHVVAKAYGTWGGRESVIPQLLTERSTFVIGPDGRVERVLRKVSARKHDELVLQSLSEPGWASASAEAGDAVLAGLERSVEKRR